MVSTIPLLCFLVIVVLSPVALSERASCPKNCHETRRQAEIDCISSPHCKVRFCRTSGGALGYSCKPDPANTPSPVACSTNDVSGVCITKSKCRKMGKHSFKGLCPGLPGKIQCCFDRNPYGACEEFGVNGECLPPARCLRQGNIPRAGLCGGDENIQCCLPDLGGCQYAGKEAVVDGRCISERSCKGKEEFSVPRLCPGPDNIKCCIPTLADCIALGDFGSCIPQDVCTGRGNVFVDDKCPNDPVNVKCCIFVGP